MPLMFHCLDVSGINAYIAHMHLCGDKSVSHCTFLLLWIQVLMTRETTWGLRMKRGVKKDGRSPFDGESPGKRKRMSPTTPSLPGKRLLNQEDHVVIISAYQRRCIYCSYLFSMEKIEGKDSEECINVRRVARYCSECNVHLCKEHFVIYHTI